MTMTVRACGSISVLPLPDLVAAAEAHGETVPVKEYAQCAVPVRCELAVEHEMDGAHCVYVKEWDDGTGNLWWRWWADGAGEFVSAPACEAVSDGDDPEACYLVASHPREHSWEIFNPLREEVTRDAQSFLPDGLGRRRPQDGPYALGMATTAEPKYTGLIFDFFGVLTFNMVEVISYFEDRERIARGTFLRAWADPRGQELFRQLELGEITQPDWNRGFAALMGVAPDNLMARYLHDAFPAHQVLNVARQARAAGIRTAVLSNSLGREPYDPYAGFDLHGTFDEVVLSAEHGVRKPDPAVFRLVLDKLGVPAGRCLFVDDSEENLAAAHRLGITPLLALDEKVVARRLREVLGLTDL